MSTKRRCRGCRKTFEKLPSHGFCPACQRLNRRSLKGSEASRQAALLVVSGYYGIPAATVMVPRGKAPYFDTRATFFKSETISDYQWSVIGWAGLLGEAIGRWGLDEFVDGTKETVWTVRSDFEHGVEDGSIIDGTDSLVFKYPRIGQTIREAARILKKRRVEFEAAYAQIKEKGFAAVTAAEGPKASQANKARRRRL